MQRKNETDVRAAFMATLRAQAGVKVFLQPMRFDVSFDKDDPIYGSPDAPVIIVEFSDFQCPYCSRVNPAMEQIKTTYGDKVAIVFRDFPLPMHKEAPKAGEAAQCANDQGKFWEYHDKLFANQRALANENLKSYAAELGLDAAAFDSCLDSGKYTAEVEEDKKAGAAVGVAGTPAFFVNGQFLNGARPFDAFKELIDAELQAKGLL
jgi:protein-disulfide isomerase